MVDPLFQIGGLASGLDTAGIIDQLMQIERVPVTRFERSQQSLRTVDSAWSRIVGKLSGFRSALDDVRRSDSLSRLTSASSSNTDAVTVTDREGGEAGSLSFTVSSLAARHRVGLAGSFSAPSGLVEAGTFTITDETGGELASITTDGTTSVQDLATQIDGLGIGVDAQVLKVTDDSYQLVLSASSTGADGTFSVTTDIASLGAASTVSTGADAHLTVGGLDVYRSSNTIDDLVPGATIQLRDTTTSDVTVDVVQDTDGIVERVQALVTAANAVLEQLATDTAYDAESGRSGALQGDSLARELAFELRDAFTQVVGTGDINYFGEIGISLTREGQLSFDEAELRTSLADDPEGVSNFLSASLTGDSGVELSFVGSDAVNGDIGMTVSQAASVASATGATYTPPAGSPKTFTITTPEGESVSVTIDDGMTAAQAVNRINAALDAASVQSLSAAVVDDGAGGEALELSSTGYGSDVSFTVAGYGADLDGTHTGQDVIADFGQGAIVGSGRSVTGDGAAAGLTLQVTGGTGTYNVAFGSGLGGVLDSFLSEMEGVDGRIQAQRDSLSGQISDFDDQIEAFEERLRLRESNLRAKFTALESTMGRLQSQGQWLAGALASLPRPSSG